MSRRVDTRTHEHAGRHACARSRRLTLTLTRACLVALRWVPRLVLHCHPLPPPPNHLGRVINKAKYELPDGTMLHARPDYRTEVPELLFDPTSIVDVRPRLYAPHCMHAWRGAACAPLR